LIVPADAELAATTNRSVPKNRMSASSISTPWRI
jgi:hypothetical protein